MEARRFHDFISKNGRKIAQRRPAADASMRKPGLDERKYLSDYRLEPTFGVVEAE
jgi:hypothetical protein